MIMPLMTALSLLAATFPVAFRISRSSPNNFFSVDLPSNKLLYTKPHHGSHI
jgi:hypothetical protein